MTSTGAFSSCSKITCGLRSDAGMRQRQHIAALQRSLGMTTAQFETNSERGANTGVARPAAEDTMEISKKTTLSKQIPARRVDHATRLAVQLGTAVLDLAGHVPTSDEPLAIKRDARARAIITTARNRSALVAGTMALPPGALGWMTLLPELMAIWRIQARMVADLAASRGKTPSLDHSQMMYCLFRHAAAQVLRDVAVQVGGRILIQDVPFRTLQQLANLVGMQVSRRLLGRGVLRWLPVIGAVGVGTYAYYDTWQVARTALIVLDAPPPTNIKAVD